MQGSAKVVFFFLMGGECFSFLIDGMTVYLKLWLSFSDFFLSALFWLDLNKLSLMTLGV